ncbi:MAG TPA: hypothetical protein VHP11_01905, partial [Tepidisphaeraceae bacterium]|nr:hypothetical protein [Tepidisphaeraceae bacterium]
AGGGASQFSITSGQPKANVETIDAALYAQDDWRLRPHLTLSYGLRFETQTSIPDHADFAPRVALAWGLGGGNTAPRTVLRAGFGVFYDRISPTLLMQTQHLSGVDQHQVIIMSPNFFPAVPPVSALSGIPVLPTVYQLDPKLRAPYVMQAAASIERQVSDSMTASVAYLHSRGLHQLLSRNINAPLPGTYDVAEPGSGIRPFGDVGNIFQYESRGIFNQDQLMTNVNLKAGSKLSLQAAYTLGYAKTDTAGPSSSPANQYDLLADYGRAAYDIRHQFSATANIQLPSSIQLSPFVTAQSGTPFNITLGRDLSGDSLFNARPAFATDLSRPGVVVTRWGVFDTAPLPGQRVIPSNYGMGPAQFSINLRLSKTMGFGAMEHSDSGIGAGTRRYNMIFGISARNLLNRLNVAAPVGNLNSPLFGQSNQISSEMLGSTSANRRVDLQVQFTF